MDRSEMTDASSAEQVGNLVTIWAHPDDETYVAGGLMAVAAATGARVTCVVATSGERGGSPDQQAELSWRREEELTEAMAALGVTDVVLLRLPDGGCAALDPARPIATIAELFDDRQPDTVATFGPDGLTGHSDHRSVSAWVSAALTSRHTTRPRLLHTATTATMARRSAHIHARFGVYEPGLPATCNESELAVHLQLDGRLLDTKIRALRSHASQTGALEAAIGPDRYRDWVATECFVDAFPPIHPGADDRLARSACAHSLL
jgi:LmbE family N-acetylglucosaminyl deacetylase